MKKHISKFYNSIRVCWPDIFEGRGKTQLMINAPAPNHAAPHFQFGGVPSVPQDEEFQWPECVDCKTPMQFLAQLPMPHQFGGQGGLLYIFMCTSEDDNCCPWEADSGANKAFCSPAKNLKIQNAPEGKYATTREICHGAVIEISKIPNYGQARHERGQRTQKWRDVVGQMGGTPGWIQGAEAPICHECGQPMRYVAQLEEGPDHATRMNFGGGCGYVFDCACNDRVAQFLWQC